MRLWEWIVGKVMKKDAPPEVKMSKIKIKFNSVDGMKVTQLAGSGIFSVKNPVDRHVPAGGTVPLNLGVSCETHAIEVFPTKYLRDLGFEITAGLGKKDVGEQLVVVLKNLNNRVTLLPEGETVLRAFALDNSGFELEGG